MPLKVGDICEGRVSGTTRFGAFVALEGGESGLVHISEISGDYVERVEDYVKRDDSVKVKVLSIGDDGKIALSIRQAQAPKRRMPAEFTTAPMRETESFEDKLSRFFKDSNDKHDQLKSRQGRRGANPRRSRGADF